MVSKMLRDILRTQQSEDVFDFVERLRLLAIEHRSDDADLYATLQQEYDVLNTDDAITVARAFTTYFELANLVEERERIRALREQVQAGVSYERLKLGTPSYGVRVGLSSYLTGAVSIIGAQ